MDSYQSDYPKYSSLGKTWNWKATAFIGIPLAAIGAFAGTYFAFANNGCVGTPLTPMDTAVNAISTDYNYDTAINTDDTDDLLTQNYDIQSLTETDNEDASLQTDDEKRRRRRKGAKKGKGRRRRRRRGGKKAAKKAAKKGRRTRPGLPPRPNWWDDAEQNDYEITASAQMDDNEDPTMVTAEGGDTGVPNLDDDEDPTMVTAEGGDTGVPNLDDDDKKIEVQTLTEEDNTDGAMQADNEEKRRRRRPPRPAGFPRRGRGGSRRRRRGPSGKRVSRKVKRKTGGTRRRRGRGPLRNRRGGRSGGRGRGGRQRRRRRGPLRQRRRRRGPRNDAEQQE